MATPNEIIQRRFLAWSDHNFPNRTPITIGLGLGEESGELQRAILKHHEGIRGTPEEWMAEIKKEIGDVFLKLCDVANVYGLDMDEVIWDRWQTIRERDWQADRTGHGMPDA